MKWQFQKPKRLNHANVFAARQISKRTLRHTTNARIVTRLNNPTACAATVAITKARKSPNPSKNVKTKRKKKNNFS